MHIYYINRKMKLKDISTYLVVFYIIITADISILDKPKRRCLNVLNTLIRTSSFLM